MTIEVGHMKSNFIFFLTTPQDIDGRTILEFDVYYPDYLTDEESAALDTVWDLDSS